MKALARTAAALAVGACLPYALDAQATSAQREQCSSDKTPTDVAIQVCTSVITAGGESVRNLSAAFNNRGSAYISKEQYELALKDFAQALKLESDPKTYYNRGNAYRGLRTYNLAIASYDTAIALKPDYGIAYGNRGLSYADLDDFDRAIQNYNRAIQLAPTSIHYYNRGLAYYAKSNLDSALKDFNLAIHADTNDAQAYRWRGIVYGRREQNDIALADFNRAIKLKPDYKFAYYSRGKLYNSMGDNAAALRDLTQAIRLDPKYMDAYKERAVAYEELKQYNLAIQDYGSAIGIDPKDADALNGRCWVRAVAGIDLQKALTDCNEALRLEPGEPFILDSRGLVFLKLKQLDAALADYNAALAKDNESAATFYARGVVKRMKGDSGGSSADFAQAKKLQPDIAQEMAKYGVQ